MICFQFSSLFRHQSFFLIAASRSVTIFFFLSSPSDFMATASTLSQTMERACSSPFFLFLFLLFFFHSFFHSGLCLLSRHHWQLTNTSVALRQWGRGDIRCLSLFVTQLCFRTGSLPERVAVVEEEEVLPGG